MPRARLLKPEFFRSEDVGSLPPMARLLFAGLWTISDRDGRMLDRPRRIAADLFPYDEDPQVDENLFLLAERGLIVRYLADGKRCIQISSFAKHQTPHHKEPSFGLLSPEQAQALSHTVAQSPGQVRFLTEIGPDQKARIGSGSGSVSDPVLSLPACDPSAAEQVEAAAIAIPQAIEAAGAEDEPAPWPGPLPPAKTSAELAVNSFGLPVLFGRIRQEIVGGIEWKGAGCKAGRPAEMAEQIAAMGAADHVEASMRQFWDSVKSGENPNAAELIGKPAQAFGYWFADFHTDYERAIGQAPKAPTSAPRAARATGPPRDTRVGWARASEQKHKGGGADHEF